MFTSGGERTSANRTETAMVEVASQPRSRVALEPVPVTAGSATLTVSIVVTGVLAAVSIVLVK